MAENLFVCVTKLYTRFDQNVGLIFFLGGGVGGNYLIFALYTSFPNQFRGGVVWKVLVVSGPLDFCVNQS